MSPSSTAASDSPRGTITKVLEVLQRIKNPNEEEININCLGGITSYTLNKRSQVASMNGFMYITY